MDLKALTARLASLSEKAATTAAKPSSALVTEIQQGTLSAMRAVYGPESSNERTLLRSIDEHKVHRPDLFGISQVIAGAIANLQAEVSAGFVGTLQARIAGEVLADLVALAREVLNETGTEAKNVGCVLAAAAYEDVMRRLAAMRSVPHHEKLVELLTALKDRGILVGSQVSIANSYLTFRNRALHAKWAEVDRPEALSVLGFTEGLISAHFV